jgi:hypothetical protein
MQSNQPPTHLDIAKLLPFEIPDECRAGVEANLELMGHHARIVDAYLTKLNTSALATKDAE